MVLALNVPSPGEFLGISRCWLKFFYRSSSNSRPRPYFWASKQAASMDPAGERCCRPTWRFRSRASTQANFEGSSFLRRFAMQKRFTLSFVAAALVCGNLFADTVQVGGKAMFPNKNIIENAMNSADHTTLVAAVKAGGLVE